MCPPAAGFNDKETGLCSEGSNFVLQFLVPSLPSLDLDLEGLNLVQPPLPALGSSQPVPVSPHPPLLFLLRIQRRIIVPLPLVVAGVDHLDVVDVHDPGPDHTGDTLQLGQDDVTVVLLCR